MRSKKTKQGSYSKIIDFSLEQDLYSVLCLHRTRKINKRLKKQKKYHYYVEWKEHIENDILTLFGTQRELDEFIRYCKLRHNNTKLFDGSMLSFIGVMATVFLTILVQRFIELKTNMVFMLCGMMFLILFMFYLGFKEIKSDDLNKSFFADIAEIAQNYKIEEAASSTSPGVATTI